MKKFHVRRVIFVVSHATAALMFLLGSSATTIGKEYRTSFAGAVTFSKDVDPVIAKHFRCDPLFAYRRGNQAAVSGGWSIAQDKVRVGTVDLSFPTVGFLQDPEGKFHTLVLCLLRFSQAVPMNQELQSGSHHILAQRDIKQDEVLAAYMVGEAVILALEGVSVPRHGKSIQVPAVVISKKPLRPPLAEDAPWFDLWRTAARAGSGKASP